MTKSTLKIKTKVDKNHESKHVPDHQEEEEFMEPVTPTGLYFHSSVLSICNLAVLEAETPIGDGIPVLKMLEDIFLPINPRFSSVMMTDKKGLKRWKRVQVIPEDHLKIPSLPQDWSLEAYDQYFDDYLTKIANEELPKDKPLWEIHVFKYPTKTSAGNCIFKIHQALGDGYSLVGALLSCFQRADDPSLPLTFPTVNNSRLMSSRKNASIFGKYLGAVPGYLFSICYGLWDFGCSLKSSMVVDDKTPIRSGNMKFESKPLRISSTVFSLDQIKQIKTKLGVSINDVVAGTIFLATRMYMEEKSQRPMKKTRTTALILLNVRDIRSYSSVEEMKRKDSSTPWGNHISLLQVPVPNLLRGGAGGGDHTKSADLNALSFVFNAQKIIKKKRKSISAYLTSWALHALENMRGAEVTSKYIKKSVYNTSLSVSNVIGPLEKMSLVDIPVKGVYFTTIGPPQSLGVSVFSYMKTLRITLAVEEGYVDRKKLVHNVESAFEMIREAAMKESL